MNLIIFKFELIQQALSPFAKAKIAFLFKISFKNWIFVRQSVEVHV